MICVPQLINQNSFSALFFIFLNISTFFYHSAGYSNVSDLQSVLTIESREIMSIRVGVIMGSQSDWDTMKYACDVLDELGVSYEKKVVSAHRTPQFMMEYASTASDRGLQVIIAGAGGAAHLPGMVASLTICPVIGVPVKSSTLHGIDSLLSIVQMPAGVPVATVAIGAAGATNAGLLAAQILAITDANLQSQLQERRKRTSESVLESSEHL